MSKEERLIQWVKILLGAFAILLIWSGFGVVVDDLDTIITLLDGVQPD